VSLPARSKRRLGATHRASLRIAAINRASDLGHSVTAHPWALPVLAAVAAVIFLWLVIAPQAGASNDTDAAASVMYFERITGGHHLESFFPTTPKPLLTVIYGLLWSLTHDWRALTIVATGVGAAAVGLATRLALRVADPAAAVFVAVALLLWPDFQTGVAQANSFVWGLGFWALAGVLVTADRPRPWLAGLALLLAGLVRVETVFLLGAVILVAGFEAVRPSLPDRRARVAHVLPLLVGAVAIPLTCLHDWLLTGQPLYWLGVPAGYTALVAPGLASESPRAFLGKLVGRYESAAGLTALAVVGWVWLVVKRRYVVAFALAALAGGVVADLFYLSYRAIFISDRYYDEANAPLTLAAAVGASVLIAVLARFVVGARPSLEWLRSGAVVVAAGLLAFLLAWPASDVGLSQSLILSRQADTGLRSVESTLPGLALGSAGATMTVSGVDYPVTDPAGARIYVPRPLLPRIAVETGIPATVLGDSYLAFRSGNVADVLRPGQYVLHIAGADGQGGAYAPFEIVTSTRLVSSSGTAVWLLPVSVDSTAGVWLVRVGTEPHPS